MNGFHNVRIVESPNSVASTLLLGRKEFSWNMFVDISREMRRWAGWWGGEWLVCNRLGAAVNTETRGCNTSTHYHISTLALRTHTNSIYTFYTDHEYYDGLGLIGRTKHFFIFDDFDTNPKK